VAVLKNAPSVAKTAQNPETESCCRKIRHHRLSPPTSYSPGRVLVREACALVHSKAHCQGTVVNADVGQLERAARRFEMKRINHQGRDTIQIPRVLS